MHHLSAATLLLGGFVQKALMLHRRLDDFEFALSGNDQEDMMMASPFDGFLDAATMEKIEECGVDLDEVVNDYLGAVMDAAMSDTEKDKAFYLDIMQEMADEGETECTEEQTTLFHDAGTEFSMCTGWNQDDLASQELQDQIQDSCGPLMDPMKSMMKDGNNDGLQQCLDTIMGDNAIGNTLRNVYHHPAKYCACLAKFADATPECLMALPDDGGSFPLSVVKKEICILEIGCDAIDDFCVGELMSLDECLPQTDDENFSCLQVMEDCSLLEMPPVSMVAPPELTMSQLPDSCVRVHDESMSGKKVVERYTQFNIVCNNYDINGSNEALQSSPVEATASYPIGLVSAILISIACVAVLGVFINKRRSNAQFGPVGDDDVELI